MPPSTSGRMVRLTQRLDALDQRVAGVDVDAGVAISHGGAGSGHGTAPGGM